MQGWGVCNGVVWVPASPSIGASTCLGCLPSEHMTCSQASPAVETLLEFLTQACTSQACETSVLASLKCEKSPKQGLPGMVEPSRILSGQLELSLPPPHTIGSQTPEQGLVEAQLKTPWVRTLVDFLGAAGIPIIGTLWSETPLLGNDHRVVGSTLSVLGYNLLSPQAPCF